MPTMGSSTVFASGTLMQVMEKGIAEHWMVHPRDLQFMPSPKMQGGFGDVRRAKLMKSSDVAIKMCRNFDAGAGKDAAAALLLKNEIRVFRRVRHPNIVLFYGVTVIHGGSLGLVLEWVAGGDYSAYVLGRHKSGEYERDLRSPATLPEVKLLQDIARGLSYLHSQTPPVLHRDLKPKNVLVEATKPPKAKLTDFGLSLLMPEGREVRARAGTKSYMAPEVRDGYPYGVPADLFSFGCVLVFTVTALSPPQAVATLASQDLSANASGTKQLPLVVLAMTCMRKDPATRPSAAEALSRLAFVPPAPGELITL